MKEKLIQYFLKISTLSEEEIKLISESMVMKKYKKETFLIEDGQTNNNTFFILEGCVRQFNIIDGEDITTNFFTENQWIISPGSFTSNGPSPHYLVCMEDTTVVVGNEQKAQELFKQYPHFETISRAVMEIVFAEQQKIMTSYITDSPEQRYLRLLEMRPEVFQRVPQYQLASYIGVKPESLSRIRKRIASRKS